jgi:L-fuconolactonase
MIVDTHTHVVGEDRAAYPLDPRPLSGAWYDEAPCSASELEAEMSAAGVDRAILVQGVGAYSYDNRYVADCAEARPGHFVAACCVDATATDAVATLQSWLARSGVDGVRLFALSAKGPSWLAEERTRGLWETAEKAGAHVIVTIFPQQLPELETVLDRHPGVRVSLDHCAFIDVAAPEPLLALADRPNLNLKVSTHVLDAAAAAFHSPQPFVSRLVETFGAERIMWGSDFCQTHDRSYAKLAEFGREAFAHLSATDRDHCLGATALQLWPGLRPG